MANPAVESVYKKLKIIRDRMDSALEPIIVGMMVLLLATVSFQVLYRFFIVKIISFSFPFSEELSLWLLVWITYLAIGICLKEGMHAAVDILAKMLNSRNRKILYIVLRTFMMIFLTLVIIVGSDLAFHAMGYRSSTMQIPMTFLYIAPVLGSILMVFQIIIEFLGVFFFEKDMYGTLAQEK